MIILKASIALFMYVFSMSQKKILRDASAQCVFQNVTYNEC